ncbi:MAG TPA: hypothetical protein VGK22_00090 [Candidatus Angelobacter sp.]
MNRGPVGQQHAFTSLSIIGLQVATAGFTVINAKARFSFNGQNCELVIVLIFAKRAPGSPVAPARTATPTCQELPAASSLTTN